MRRWLLAAFAIDLLVALLPPIHWATNGTRLVAGLPSALAYQIFAGALIAATVVAAWLTDADRTGADPEGR